MEDLLEGVLEAVLSFLEYRFETIQNPVLRMTVQILSMIAACALVLAAFFGIYRLFTR